MTELNILLAVRYQILRDGVEKILADESGFRVKETAKNKEDLFALPIEEGEVLVLDADIADLNPPEIIQDLKERNPDIHILVFSEMQNPEFIKEIMQSGASGYLFKRQSSNELVNGIKEVAAGKKFLCNEIIQLLLQEGDIGKKVKNSKDFSVELTDRELQVLALICQEMTNKEIGDKLHISVRTVDAHRRNILQKTGAKNTAGLVKYAIKHQIYNV